MGWKSHKDGEKQDDQNTGQLNETYQDNRHRRENRQKTVQKQALNQNILIIAEEDKIGKMDIFFLNL